MDHSLEALYIEKCVEYLSLVNLVTLLSEATCCCCTYAPRSTFYETYNGSIDRICDAEVYSANDTGRMSFNRSYLAKQAPCRKRWRPTGPWWKRRVCSRHKLQLRPMTC